VRAELFLSYAHEDEHWAAALEAQLIRRSCGVFRDKSDIPPGATWREEIQQALDTCPMLVCLWSRHCGAWPIKEVAYFEGKRKRVCIVRLDDTANSFEHLQQERFDPLQQAYAVGRLPSGDADIWAAVCSRIADALYSEGTVFSLPVAIFTLTRKEFEDIGVATRGVIQQTFGLSGQSLEERYPGARSEWRPFQESWTRSIGGILDDLEVDLSKRLGKYAKLRVPGDDFLDVRSGTGAKELAKQMRSGRFGALVIDPIALCVGHVVSGLQQFDACLAEPGISVIVVPVHHSNDVTQRLRVWLSVKADTFFNWSKPAPKARVATSVDDLEEFSRIFTQLAAAKLRASRRDAASRLPYRLVPAEPT
jgi:hypothetical protein